MGLCSLASNDRIAHIMIITRIIVITIPEKSYSVTESYSLWGFNSLLGCDLILILEPMGARNIIKTESSVKTYFGLVRTLLGLKLLTQSCSREVARLKATYTWPDSKASASDTSSQLMDMPCDLWTVRAQAWSYRVLRAHSNTMLFNKSSMN